MPSRNDLSEHKKQLESLLLARLKPYPSVVHDVLPSALDVIIFGSYPVGLERPNSDLDVLILGQSRMRIKTRLLDLVVLPENEAERPIWARTEIFRHIATYGISLMRESCRLNIVIDDYAANHKAGRIVTFVRGLAPVWNVLDDSFRRKYLTKLRRETQRFRILKSGSSVPPTVVLDSSADSIEHWNSIYDDMIELIAAMSPKDVEAAKRIVGESQKFFRPLAAHR